MNHTVTVLVIIAMFALTAWIVTRLDLHQRRGLAAHRYTDRQTQPGPAGSDLPTQHVPTERVGGFPALHDGVPCAAHEVGPSGEPVPGARDHDQHIRPARPSDIAAARHHQDT